MFHHIVFFIVDLHYFSCYPFIFGLERNRTEPNQTEKHIFAAAEPIFFSFRNRAQTDSNIIDYVALTFPQAILDLHYSSIFSLNRSSHLILLVCQIVGVNVSNIQ